MSLNQTLDLLLVCVLILMVTLFVSFFTNVLPTLILAQATAMALIATVAFIGVVRHNSRKACSR